jgi:hypothetical protein
MSEMKKLSEVDVTQAMLDAGATLLEELIGRFSAEYIVHTVYAQMERVRRGEVIAPFRYVLRDDLKVTLGIAPLPPGTTVVRVSSEDGSLDET